MNSARRTTAGRRAAPSTGKEVPSVEGSTAAVKFPESWCRVRIYMQNTVFTEGVGSSETFCWTIVDWNLVKRARGDKLESEPLQTGTVTWVVHIYPSGHDIDEKKSPVPIFEVYLIPDQTCTATYTMWGDLFNDKKDNRITEPQRIVTTAGKGWKWRRALPAEYDGNRLTLYFSITVVEEARVLPVGQLRPLLRTYEKDVTRVLGHLFDHGLKTDVTFLVHGESICAHRMILEGRSPVFAAMFNQPMAESLSGEVVVQGILTSVFRALLRFVYTGDCELAEPQAESKHEKAAASLDPSSASGHLLLSTSRVLTNVGGTLSSVTSTATSSSTTATSSSTTSTSSSTTSTSTTGTETKKKEKEKKEVDPDFVCELLAAADQYQLPGLVQMCSSYLLATMNESNVIVLFQLAEQCKAEELYAWTLIYMTQDKTRLSRIMDQPIFRSLTRYQCQDILSASVSMPDRLQNEVRRLRQWSSLKTIPGEEDVTIVERSLKKPKLSDPSRSSPTSSSSSFSSSSSSSSSSLSAPSSFLSLSQKTVVELKALCRSHGLPVGGTRDALIARCYSAGVRACDGLVCARWPCVCSVNGDGGL